MFTKSKILFMLGLMAALFAGGCLVSGTFTVIQTLNFSVQTGFYPEAIDLTDNEDWEEHRENIDRIELVGFELWITDNNSAEWKVSAYMDNYNDTCLSQSCFDTSTTKFQVLKEITIPASNNNNGSQKYIAYANSFDFLDNIAAMKAKVLSGQFNVFGIATGGSTGVIDSLKVIITVNASDT